MIEYSYLTLISGEISYSRKSQLVIAVTHIPICFYQSFWPKWLKHWILNPWVLRSKPLGASVANSTFYHSEVDKVSKKIPDTFVVKSNLSPRKAFVTSRQMNPIYSNSAIMLNLKGHDNMLGEQIQQNRLLLRKSNQSFKIPTKNFSYCRLNSTFPFLMD